MKRVACLVTNDLNHDQRMRRICSALTEAGYQVTLIGRQLKTSGALTKQPFAQERLICLFKSGPLFYLEYNVRLYIYLLRHRFDVVNTVDADTLLAAGLLNILVSFKWVHDAHELFTEVPELVGKGIKRTLWLSLEKWAFKRIDAFYTVSESVLKWYAPMVLSEAGVIRNVPLKQEMVEVSKKSDDDFILIYQGALNEGRCIELYIMAMQELDAMLWIAGEGDLSQSLRNLTRELGLEEKVKFLGWQSPENLRLLTQQADVGLNVLEDKGLSYRYSLANKCFDYIHAGLPAIHPKFPEYSRLNEQFDIFVFADANVRSIIKAVNLLRFDPKKYQRLRDNCNIASGYLDWTTEKEKLVAIYERTR